MVRNSGPLQLDLEQLHRSHVSVAFLPLRTDLALAGAKGLQQMADQWHQ